MEIHCPVPTYCGLSRGDLLRGWRHVVEKVALRSYLGVSGPSNYNVNFVEIEFIHCPMYQAS